MKRFITVSAKHAEEILILMRNAAAGAAGVDAYNWLKKKLDEKQIANNDQHANHHNELPIKAVLFHFISIQMVIGCS